VNRKKRFRFITEVMLIAQWTFYFCKHEVFIPSNATIFVAHFQTISGLCSNGSIGDRRVFFQSCDDVTTSRWDWVGARVLYFVGVWVQSELGMLCMKLVGFFKPVTDLSQPWTIFFRVGASGDKNCNSSKTGSCWCCQWSIGVGAGNFLGVRRIFCPDFPKFARKNFLYKLSPYKFSVAVGKLHFPQPCCHTAHTSLFRWQINSTVTKVYKKIYKLIKLNILQARS